MILLLPMAFADIQELQTTINIRIIENSTLNITTEQDTHIYQSNSNSTNTFILTIKRNITSCEGISNSINNLTKNYDTLINSCDLITKENQKLTNYFTLYTECHTENTLCQKDKNETITELNTYKSYKSDLDACNTNYNQAQAAIRDLNAQTITLQGNITSCNTDLSNAQSNKWVWGFIGALIIGFMWTLQNKKIFPSKKTGGIPKS